MSRSSYAPNEPGDIIIDEVAWLQGAFLSTLLCGVQITLSAMSFLAVLKQGLHRRLRIALLVYISLLCIVMTAGQQFNLLYVQIGFIEARNYPGGPNGYLSEQYGMPVDLVSTSLFVFANWMMESLLVWRCKVVCVTGDQPMWIGVILPLVLLVSEFVTGSLFIYDISMDHKLDDGYTPKTAIAYMGLSLVLNITVTGIIVGRLLLHRRRVVRQFGPSYGSNYVSAATILIESASFYTASLILFIALSSVGSAATNILQQLVAHVESITSLLIIYRIARGKGWTGNVDVSSLAVDWRGDSEPQVQPEVVDLEMAADPVRTSVQAQSISSKEDETPMPMSTSSVNATLTQDDVV